MMRIGSHNTAQSVFIIAEIGNNHEGSLSRAKEMIAAAAEAGANAVKFQTYRTELFIRAAEKKRFEQLRSYQLSFADFEDLAVHSEALGVMFLSTPFDLESAQFLEPLVPAFKIGSGENVFYPLLKSVAASNKPIILSTGMADLEEVRRSKSYIEECWRAQGLSQELALLHCVSSYPTPADQVNIMSIPYLAQEFDCVTGYSDHTLGINASLAAVAVGARIIEKHFTLDKEYSSFRDHQLSADPRELSSLVKNIREVESMLGSTMKCIQDCEAPTRPLVRRSITAIRDLESGTIVSSEDICWTRPSGGIAPGDEELIVGRIAKQAIPAGEWILVEHVE